MHEISSVFVLVNNFRCHYSITFGLIPTDVLRDRNEKKFYHGQIMDTLLETVNYPSDSVPISIV